MALLKSHLRSHDDSARPGAAANAAQRAVRADVHVYERFSMVLREIESAPTSPVLAAVDQILQNHLVHLRQTEESQRSAASDRPPMNLHSLSELVGDCVESASPMLKPAKTPSSAAISRSNSARASRVPPPIITSFASNSSQARLARVQSAATAKDAPRQNSSSGGASGGKHALKAGNRSALQFKDASPEADGHESGASTALEATTATATATATDAGTTATTGSGLTASADALSGTLETSSPPLVSPPESKWLRSLVDYARKSGRQLPYIPTSPLCIQLEHYQKRVQSAESQLCKLAHPDVAASESAVARRQRLKVRLQRYQKSLQSAEEQRERYPASRSVSTVDARELARVIAGFNWDLLLLVNVERDLEPYACAARSWVLGGQCGQPPAMPRRLQSLVDFGVFLRNVIVMTVVSPYRQQEQVITTWIQVGHQLRMRFNDQQGASIVAEALQTPEVQSFQAVWTSLRPDIRDLYESLCSAVRTHEHLVASELAVPVFRPMNPVILNVRRLVATLHCVDWSVSMHRALQSMQMYKRAYHTLFEQRQMKVAHWLVSQKWLDLHQAQVYAEQHKRRQNKRHATGAFLPSVPADGQQAAPDGADIVSLYSTDVAPISGSAVALPVRKNSIGAGSRAGAGVRSGVLFHRRSPSSGSVNPRELTPPASATSSASHGHAKQINIDTVRSLGSLTLKDRKAIGAVDSASLGRGAATLQSMFGQQDPSSTRHESGLITPVYEHGAPNRGALAPMKRSGGPKSPTLPIGEIYGSQNERSSSLRSVTSSPVDAAPVRPNPTTSPGSDASGSTSNESSWRGKSLVKLMLRR